MPEDIEESKKDQGLTIGRRLIAVMDAVKYLQKDGEMTGGQKYKYVSHDQVVEAVREHVVAAGIIIVPRVVDTITETQTVEGYNGKKVTEIFCTVKMEFDWCSADDLTDKFTVSMIGMGLDRSDKACGKAISYAKKAMLLNTCLLATGEDPDHDQNYERGAPAQTNNNGQSHREQRTQAQTQAKAATAPAVDWNKKCTEQLKLCDNAGVIDDGRKIWKEHAKDPKVMAYKLHELQEKANAVLNEQEEPPF